MKTIAFACLACLLLGVSITKLPGFSFNVVFGLFASDDEVTNAQYTNGSSAVDVGMAYNESLHLVRRFLSGLFFLCLIFLTGFVGAGFLFMSMARKKKNALTDAD